MVPRPSKPEPTLTRRVERLVASLDVLCDSLASPNPFLDGMRKDAIEIARQLRILDAAGKHTREAHG